MSNTVITNYTDLNGPSTKADSSVVVIVNKDGSLSVDQKLLGTLMGSDGAQGAISVVRVGHEGCPDDATDSETEDDKRPHITLSVDSYFEEPNSIIKYDSGAEMLQSFRIETRENSLLGFQNDHCYTPLTSPEQSTRARSDYGYDDPIIEIRQEPPPRPMPSSKKITILEQKILPRGRKIPVSAMSSHILKGNEALGRPLPQAKSKKPPISEESTEESSSESSDDSILDRDSDSDYKDREGGRGGSAKKIKSKAKIMKVKPTNRSKLDTKSSNRSRSELTKHEKLLQRQQAMHEFNTSHSMSSTEPKTGSFKQLPKPVKKPKKLPVNSALLSDMSSLFSTPDVIRRVSTELKAATSKDKVDDKHKVVQRANKQRLSDKNKSFDPMPQIDDASLAQILQDTTPGAIKNQASNSMNSPSLAGPLSPTLDLLASLQPEEEGLTEDLLMHVAQLVESSENLQEVIDKQVLGKVDTSKALASSQLAPGDNMYTPGKSAKVLTQRKDPIEVVRRDGRVITLPPIEAPATRSSKRKTQGDPSSGIPEPLASPVLPTMEPQTMELTPEPPVPVMPPTKMYIAKKLPPKKVEELVLMGSEPVSEKFTAESQESWGSEDDPNRLWCICRQPHNNRFMICCDGCEDWFHGKCVNITKAMGQQMEDQGIEWRCPKCTKKNKSGTPKPLLIPKTPESEALHSLTPTTSKHTPDPRIIKARSGCIVCRKPARASSIYCSDACILKHAQDSLGPPSPTKPGAEGAKPDKMRDTSRVIVFERKTGRCLAGPNAPTAENLKDWLQRNPTFEVVRPGTLSAIKPNIKKLNEPKRIQTTLNFDKIPKKVSGQSVLKPQGTTPHIFSKSSLSPAAKSQLTPATKSPMTPATKSPMMPATKSPMMPVTKSPMTPAPKSLGQVLRTQQMPVREQQGGRMSLASPPTPRPQPASPFEPKPGPSNARVGVSQPDNRKPAARVTTSRSQSTKASTSPAASRRKEPPEGPKSRMVSEEPIRENVRKALQEQITIRMKETTQNTFTAEDIKKFANETEAELHDLFNKDVGVKYKAKYRSLMFNIKDRKNLTLWDKICEKTITPKQLVRLSPEELASQELAQWRDKESKYQLELIKKSELDLLAASKTYVLKTHKGEEVMESKQESTTELDPNLRVEDLVTALNEPSVLDESNVTEESFNEKTADKSPERRSSKRKHKDREDSSSRQTTRESKRETDTKKSKSSSRADSDSKKDSRQEQEDRPSRRSERSNRSGRKRSPSKEKKKEPEEEKERRSEERVRSSSRRKTRSSTHSRSKSQERERSQSRRRSRSREAKRKQRSRSKDKTKPADKNKKRSKSQDNSKKKKKLEAEPIERPRSVMQKDAHPEYDPHEPMITSAFSEEDLRKSGEDMYDDSLRGDLGDFVIDEYDTPKPFTIDTNALPKYSSRRDKASEGESDQEPSSTVENAAAIVWNGCINMVDVARFYVAAHDISGNAADLEEEINTELDIVGRINPEMVWEYIGKMRRAGNKDIIVLRLEAANDEEKMQYIALYSYLSSRNRLGVVKVSSQTSLKDFYILPISASSPLPPVLLPLDGPGLGDVKTHLLIAVVVRQRKKRVAANIPKETPPAKITRSMRKRSSTPVPTADLNAIISSFSSPSVSSTKKDKLTATVSSNEAEPYSPGSPTRDVDPPPPPPPPDKLRTKMEELNRQIEEQKQQIRKLTSTEPSAGDDEAYSPSRPMTPPSSAPVTSSLADIALPSNLHEILATIKQRSGDSATPAATTTDVDMRALS